MRRLPSRSGLLAVLRDAPWLNGERVFAWTLVLLAVELLILLFLAAWQHGLIVRMHQHSASDFVSFYAAGKLAVSGHPALAYDHAAHYLAEQQASVRGMQYQFFFYPPVFLLLCAILARLPYFLSMAAFETLTLGLFLLTMRSLLGARGWRWAIPVLAFPAVFWNIGVGQNAFLTASLFAGFTLLLDRRPLSAGLLVGTLCYKPHFGLLAPVALAAAGRWRAFIAAAACVVALAGLSAWLFGWSTWQAYFHSFAGSSGVYASGRIQLAGMVTPFAGMRLLGAPVSAACVVQAAASLTAAVVVALVWRGRGNPADRAAALLAGTLVAVPVALLYDQMLWLVATAWLVRDGRREGFLPWEKLVLATCYAAVLLTWPIGTGLHLPLGPVVSLAVLALVVRRVWRRRAAVAPPKPHPAATPALGATP